MRFALAVVLAVAAPALAAGPASAQPACGDVLTQDTTLTGDLDCRDGDLRPALTVGAPGITLDLGGHDVWNDGEVVRNQGHDNVTIRNGAVHGSNPPVHLIGVSGNTVRGLEVTGSNALQKNPGIVLDDSDANRIVSNEVNAVMLWLYNGSDLNVVRGNLVHQLGGWIDMVASNQNRIVENVVWTFRNEALELTAAQQNEIRRNTLITSNGDPAIRMTVAHFNTIAGNVIVKPGRYAGVGVRLDDSSWNVIRGNGFWGVHLGLRLASGLDNELRGNEVHGTIPQADAWFPDADGFRVNAEASGTLVQNNSLDGFDDDGIDVQAPTTTITRNTARDNGDLGIDAVVGVTDGGGNTASGNGNPLQCVNVFCSP
jgi:Periplasmic copper-binding protein (NosD)/Right handed beta helix region